MVTQLLLATRNAHKTSEFQDILGPRFQVSDLRSLPNLPEVEETGSTFEENAALKAVAASRAISALVAADDSGLEVDALKGAPGVYSARYAGADASDQQNMEKLLRALKRVGASSRSARFRCALVLAREGEKIAAFDGEVEGLIVNAPRGEEGFGYDPIFVPKGYDRTFAELGTRVKNQLSHRARAIRNMMAYFERELKLP